MPLFSMPSVQVQAGFLSSFRLGVPSQTVDCEWINTTRNLFILLNGTWDTWVSIDNMRSPFSIQILKKNYSQTKIKTPIFPTTSKTVYSLGYFFLLINISSWCVACILSTKSCSKQLQVGNSFRSRLHSLYR